MTIFVHTLKNFRCTHWRYPDIQMYYLVRTKCHYLCTVLSLFASVGSYWTHFVSHVVSRERKVLFLKLCRLCSAQSLCFDTATVDAHVQSVKLSSTSSTITVGNSLFTSQVEPYHQLKATTQHSRAKPWKSFLHWKISDRIFPLLS